MFPPNYSRPKENIMKCNICELALFSNAFALVTLSTQPGVTIRLCPVCNHKLTHFLLDPKVKPISKPENKNG
jgi:hypothetical protein